MTWKKVRGRILAGCVVTMLFLQAGAALAQSALPSMAGPCSVEQASEVAAPSAQAPFFVDVSYVRPDSIGGSPGTSLSTLTSAEVAAPWSPQTFVLVETAKKCPSGPVGVRPSAADTAKTQSATLPLGIPGAVTNLRRADQR